MRKEVSDPLAPKFYLPSKSHSDYQNLAWEYFLEHYGNKLLRKGRVKRSGGLGLDHPKVLAAVYYQKMADGRVDSLEIDDYVIHALKLFSGEIIRLCDSLSPFRLSDDANKLGGMVCRFLGSLISQAGSHDYIIRKQAKERFSRIVRSISPDARGKKRVTASPFSVQSFYWRQLFRLYHVEKALKSKRNFHLAVNLASQNYGLSVALIREFWGLDETDTPYRQRLGLQEMARELTARHFKITLHRVSNILAS